MIFRILLIIGILAALFAGQAVAWQQDLAGTWIGHWEREGATLHVEETTET